MSAPPLDAKDFADYLRQHATSQRPNVRAELEHIADEMVRERAHVSETCGWASHLMFSHMRPRFDNEDTNEIERCITALDRLAANATVGPFTVGPFDTADQLIAALDAPEPVRERGPWNVYIKDGRAIGVLSEDFHHDALLRVSGDFADDAKRLEYCQLIAALLNEAIAARNAQTTGGR
jgi:hypothetical protein